MSPIPLSYVACEDLGDRPHVMVDGAARPSSVLTLSHWPGSPTPVPLARDLSADIVLGLIGAVAWSDTGVQFPPARRVAGDPSGAAVAVHDALAAVERAVAVTCDHFDEDGLIAVYALVDPVAALGAAELLVDVASCGDFGVVRSDEAARICFAIGPLADQEAPGSGTSERYAAVLPRLPELLEHPERFERYWSNEWAALAAGRAALEAPTVVIDDHPDVDLAVVRVTASGADGGGAGPIDAGYGRPIHRAAVHSATGASRILAFDGASCELCFRYESWVRVVSRAVPLRPDLSALVAELSAAEPSGSPWEDNGVGATVARVRPAGGQTEIDPAIIVRMVARHLVSAPPAWDPFRAGSPYIPAGERDSYARQRLPTGARRRLPTGARRRRTGGQ